ncbi:hypothetical protein SAMN03097708_01980 [Thiohalomonas denitrificans]|uniref:Uncharacterized protein n=1 Tax=Thiohalomonas denitrificans TaxID=415747 RepID=A0A1G5QEK0_9GAMM|nr:hypothetical protein SAMN03097708_01980 [Thiohalomonas denitrificans]
MARVTAVAILAQIGQNVEVLRSGFDFEADAGRTIGLQQQYAVPQNVMDQVGRYVIKHHQIYGAVERRFQSSGDVEAEAVQRRRRLVAVQNP